MATSWSATAGNAALDTLLAAYPWIKLYVGTPGAAGTTNPAVETTRQQATWTSAAAGSASNSADLVWTNVAASEDFTFCGGWTLVTGGVFGWSGIITAAPVTAGNTFTIPAGGLVVSLTLAS